MMEIMTVKYELRPCIVGAKKRRGLFHRWVEDAHAGVVGVVEYEDGHVARVKPNTIYFLDSASKFEEFEWEDKEQTE